MWLLTLHTVDMPVFGAVPITFIRFLLSVDVVMPEVIPYKVMIIRVQPPDC